MLILMHQADALCLPGCKWVQLTFSRWWDQCVLRRIITFFPLWLYSFILLKNSNLWQLFDENVSVLRWYLSVWLRLASHNPPIIFTVLWNRLDAVGSLWGHRLAAQWGGDDTPTVLGLLQSMLSSALLFHLQPCGFWPTTDKSHVSVCL